MANHDLIEHIANSLIDAEDRRQELPAFTDKHPELDESTGYAIQDRTLQTRLDRGETLIGLKLGLTSKAKQERMNVDTPIVGWLTDAHHITQSEHENNGRSLPQRFIHPRVEPEIVVTLKSDLEGENITVEQVAQAIDKVYAGLDVIDSRYQDFRFKLGDVVADNASGAAYILGPIALDLDDIDVAAETVEIVVDGEVVDRANGTAILGHPLNAIAEGVRLLARRGHKLSAGQTVLAGALTDAIATDQGQTIEFRFTNLGTITLVGNDS